MGLCCYLSSIEVLIFYIGAFFILRWVWRIVKTVKEIYQGTKVTTERYGQKGKVWAVVTGCTDGIGKAIAIELANRGFNIVLVSRNIDKLNATAKDIREKFAGIQTRILVFDFTEDTSVEAYTAFAKKINDIDIGVLVNNVGVAVPFQNTPQSTYKEIACNCYPIVLLTQQLVLHMEERFQTQKQRSLIINLSSQAALMPSPHHLNYAATKVFDDYFSKSLFYELRAKGVDVLTVNPGMVATAMTRRKVDLKQFIISADECAKGCLDKATAFQTFGGNWHELSGLLAKCLLLDIVPMSTALFIAEKVGRQIKEGQKKVFKSE